MPAKQLFQIHHYAKNGLPCFCHFGYISNYHKPHNLNWHKDIEILVCTMGDGYISYGNEEVLFSPGDAVMVNSGISHAVRTNTHIEYYYLIINPEFMSENGLEAENILFSKKVNDSKLTDIFMKIVAITHSEDKHRVLKTRLYCTELLLLLSEKYTVSHTGTDYTPLAVHARKAMEFLQCNYSKPITVDEVASYVGINRSRMTKEFKQYSGYTILEQLNKIRCSNAKKLISAGGRISEAARSCGFENKSYFTKMYKKYIGELPTETRKKTD